MKYEQRVLSVLERRIERKELRRLVRAIIDAYSSNLMDAEVWRMITSILPDSLSPFVERWSRVYVGHEFVSALALRYDPGEATIKYHLTCEHRDSPDEVSLFEFVVDTNRLDYGRINGNSYAYEIKTELDSLARLVGQTQAYARVFEYVTVVLDQRHVDTALGILPPFCGVETYALHDGACAFQVLREAQFSPELDPNAQIANLTSDDLEQILRTLGFAVPRYRAERADVVRCALDGAEINSAFKVAVKGKYEGSWTYVRQHFADIHALDIQSFYHGLRDPHWAYFKRSAMVYR